MGALAFGVSYSQSSSGIIVVSNGNTYSHDATVFIGGGGQQSAGSINGGGAALATSGTIGSGLSGQYSTYDNDSTYTGASSSTSNGVNNGIPNASTHNDASTTTNNNGSQGSFASASGGSFGSAAPASKSLRDRTAAGASRPPSTTMPAELKQTREMNAPFRRRTMKRIAWGVLALIMVMMPAVPTFAAGAVAVGLPGNVAISGVAAGISIDRANSRDASSEALSLCKAGKVGFFTRSLCTVVKTFSHQCAAIAADPKRGGSGFGWGVASSRRAAEGIALAQCKASSSPGRAAACKAATVACDKVGGT
ncbi:MAG: DUF4189 domain-containing protein [Bauldia sp.]